MTSQDLVKILAFQATIKAWKQAGDCYQQINNNERRLHCRKQEAQAAFELAMFQSSLIPNSQPEYVWHAKIAP